ESTISSLRTLRSSLSTVTLPAASVCRIVNVSLCDIVTDCSLEKKSSLSIVATLVLESFDHSPMEWELLRANCFTASGALRSELPYRMTCLSAETLIGAYLFYLSRSCSVVTSYG